MVLTCLKCPWIQCFQGIIRFWLDFLKKTCTLILNATSALNGSQRFPGWDWVSGMIDDDKAAQAVCEAVKREYHQVDTGNARGVGEGVPCGGCSRPVRRLRR